MRVGGYKSEFRMKNIILVIVYMMKWGMERLEVGILIMRLEIIVVV